MPGSKSDLTMPFVPQGQRRFTGVWRRVQATSFITAFCMSQTEHVLQGGVTFAQAVRQSLNLCDKRFYCAVFMTQTSFAAKGFWPSCVTCISPHAGRRARDYRPEVRRKIFCAKRSRKDYLRLHQVVTLQ